jgi:hypothetical protein
VWQEVEAMLNHAHIKTQAIVTERPGHAVEELSRTDFTPWTTIAVIGGDGSVHEVLQVRMASLIGLGKFTSLASEGTSIVGIFGPNRVPGDPRTRKLYWT